MDFFCFLNTDKKNYTDNFESSHIKLQNVNRAARNPARFRPKTLTMVRKLYYRRSVRGQERESHLLLFIPFAFHCLQT